MKAIKSLLIAAAALIIMPCTAMAFTDMPSGETGEALENAVNNGIITGYDDGLIKPDNHITRAEMAAMLTKITIISFCTPDTSTTVTAKYSKTFSTVWT